MTPSATAEGAPERRLLLAVDSQPEQLSLLRRALEPLHVELCTAGSAEAAFEAMLAERPDLVLLDRASLGASGLAFLRRLHAHQELSRIPVIVRTGSVSTSELREGLAAGATHYVSKSLDHELLRSVVRGALQRTRSLGPKRAKVPHPLLARLSSGCFCFRTLEQARELALSLAELCERSELAALGLCELMVNAVEHGNLEISYDEKTRLCRAGTWQQEVERRLRDPAYCARAARVLVERNRERVRFEIRDEGPGFDWRDYLSFDSERAFDPNGRGIALAQGAAFSNLRYEERGNVVIAEAAPDPGP